MEYLLFKLLHSVMVSTKVFGTFSIGPNPIEVTTFSFGVMVSTGGSNPLSVGSNPTGRTNKNSMEEKIKVVLEKSLELVRTTDKLVRDNKLENSQEFLDWQDELNALSVK